MTTIHTILTEFRDAANSNREMGDKFERLIANYLVTDPLQKERFSDVWLWCEWPGRGNQPDTGIDLVAKELYTGEYCAIQCKFYAKGHTVQKADIDSFFTASGKKPFTSRMIVATTEFGKHAEEAMVNQQPALPLMRGCCAVTTPRNVPPKRFWSFWKLTRLMKLSSQARCVSFWCLATSRLN